MKLVTALAASALLALAACSSDSTANSSSGGGEGVTGEGVAAPSSAPDTNPAGDKYPTDNLGITAGKVIQNFKFVGYPDAKVTDGLKPVSLAQFYDPKGETYKLIHIQAAGSWCSVCRGETTALMTILNELKQRGVVWIVSIAEGASPGGPSTKTDVDKWISDFNSPFTHVLDPNNKNLGVFYNRSALPWNASIDPRTMTIIKHGTGGATTAQRLLSEIDEALAKIAGQ